MTIAPTDNKSICLSLSHKLAGKSSLLSTRKIAAGFDAFIDTIINIVETKNDDSPPSYFQTIREFGEYIISKSKSSFSLEGETKTEKPGGNMAIMGNALGQLGASVSCVGPFGYPAIHPAFQQLSSNCHLHSFSNPGTAVAYEFTDGKIMIAQMASLNVDGWDVIRERVGSKALLDIFASAELFCLVNWSEIDMSSNIWQGLITDILPAMDKQEQPFCFADLSDCSKRSAFQINEALQLLGSFNLNGKLHLGLNRNEAGIVFESLFRKKAPADLVALGERIHDHLQPGRLLLHANNESCLFDQDIVYHAHSFFTDRPRLSTGAGDNFNAGYCAALLLGLDGHESLVVANAVAGFYVRNAKSPSTDELIDFLKDQSK